MADIGLPETINSGKYRHLAYTPALRTGYQLGTVLEYSAVASLTIYLTMEDHSYCANNSQLRPRQRHDTSRKYLFPRHTATIVWCTTYLPIQVAHSQRETADCNTKYSVKSNPPPSISDKHRKPSHNTTISPFHSPISNFQMQLPTLAFPLPTVSH